MSGEEFYVGFISQWYSPSASGLFTVTITVKAGAPCIERITYDDVSNIECDLYTPGRLYVGTIGNASLLEM